jgi:hypothetical protein
MTNVNPKFVVLRDRYSPGMLFTPTVRIARKYVEGKFSEEMFQDLQDGLVMDALGSRVAARKVEFLSVKTAGMRQSYKTALEHLKQLENSGTFTLGPRPGQRCIFSPHTYMCVRSLRCTPIHPSRQDHADGLVPWPGIHPYPRKGGASWPWSIAVSILVLRQAASEVQISGEDYPGRCAARFLFVLGAHQRCRLVRPLSMSVRLGGGACRTGQDSGFP